MLGLLSNGAFVRQVPESATLEVEPLLWVSGAADGWEHGSHALRTIVRQNPPQGASVRSWSVEMIDGVPTEIAELLPPPTIEQIRDAMPDLNPAQMRLALFEIGVTEADIEVALADDPRGLIEWRTRPRYRRLHHLVVRLSAADKLNVPAAQIDDLWMWAAGL